METRQRRDVKRSCPGCAWELASCPPHASGWLTPLLQTEHIVGQGHPESKRLSSSSFIDPESGCGGEGPSDKNKASARPVPPTPRGPLTLAGSLDSPSVCKHLPHRPGCEGGLTALPSHPTLPGCSDRGEEGGSARQGAWQVGLAGSAACVPRAAEQRETWSLSLGSARLCSGSLAQIRSSAQLESAPVL